MDVLDEAKVTNRVLVDVRSEQDRVAEEKIEAARGKFLFHCEVWFSSGITVLSQLPRYAGYFQTIQPTNTKISGKNSTRVLGLGFSTPRNSSLGIRSPLGYSAMGNVFHPTVLLDVPLWKANERR